MWSAPTERSGDGALDSLGVLRLANPKRRRAPLASALQNEFFSSLLGRYLRTPKVAVRLLAAYL
jgi:hypothetical protein